MRLILIVAIGLLLAGCSKSSVMTHAHGKPLTHWTTALNDKDPKVRKKAAEVLGSIGAVDESVVPALIGALKDRDASVRAEATLAILKIGPPAQEAVPVLSELTKDRDANVRDHAVKALARIQNSK